jgi:hypothetical protein
MNAVMERRKRYIPRARREKILPFGAENCVSQCLSFGSKMQREGMTSVPFSM